MDHESTSDGIQQSAANVQDAAPPIVAEHDLTSTTATTTKTTAQTKADGDNDPSTQSAIASHPLTERVLGDTSAAPDLQKGSHEDLPQVNTGDEERAVDPSINDLGWSQDPHVPIPILYGIKNEDVWQLVRRFNNQVYHLKLVKPDEPLQGGMDMNIAEKDQFTPEKLRSTLERIYITIGLGLAAFVKHVARVRSWHERKRTSLFFLAFLAVWALDVVMPALFAFLTVLLASPYARLVLFPPAPLSAISAKTGKARVPKSGQLGSESLTGAAESYKGEAAEQEASNAVGTVAHLAVSTAIGNDAAKVQNYSDVEDDDSSSQEKDDDEDERREADLPDPSKVALTSKKAQSKAKGDKHTAPNQEDKAAAPVEHSIWTSAQPVLHALEDAADTWERFGNALAPTPPFPQRMPRLRIAGIVAPLALVSFFVSSRLVYRSTTLLLGLAFFGQPVLDMMKVSDVKAWLDKNIPDWQRYLELRNSILKGVPTNAQLTITLLRIGEAKKSPLPPPPAAVVAPPPTAKEGSEMQQDIPDEYRKDFEEKRQEQQREEQEAGAAAEQDGVDGQKGSTKKKGGSKFMALFKGSVKAGAETALGTNRVKAEVGFQRAKEKVGVVHTQPDYASAGDGPAGFHARYKGKRGLALISTSSTTPCVSFERAWPAHARAAHAAYIKARDISDSQTAADNDGARQETDAVKSLRELAEKARPTPLFSIQLDDICSLRKLGGLGWKSKLIVGWSMEGQVDDGLEIETVDGQKFIITAMPRRDELFNRLASLGKDHMWESW